MSADCAESPRAIASMRLEKLASWQQQQQHQQQHQQQQQQPLLQSSETDELGASLTGPMSDVTSTTNGDETVHSKYKRKYFRLKASMTQARLAKDSSMSKLDLSKALIRERDDELHRARIEIESARARVAELEAQLALRGGTPPFEPDDAPPALGMVGALREENERLTDYLRQVTMLPAVTAAGAELKNQLALLESQLVTVRVTAECERAELLRQHAEEIAELKRRFQSTLASELIRTEAATRLALEGAELAIERTARTADI